MTDPGSHPLPRPRRRLALALAVALCLPAAARAASAALTLSDEVSSVEGASGANNGGDAFSDPCPAGQAVIGVQGTYGESIFGDGASMLASFQAACGSLSAVLPDAPALAAAAGVAATGDLTPVRGAAGTWGPWSLACPADQVVVGFDAWVDNITTYLALRCAPVLVSYDAGAGWGFSTGAAQATAGVGGLGNASTVDLGALDCGQGLVASGLHGKAGQAMDRFGLSCAAPDGLSDYTPGVAVASSQNPSLVGQAVVFTATVGGVLGAAVPSGSVVFRDGDVELGSAPLDAAGTAALPAAALGVGPHAITASFPGDASYGPAASAALAQDVAEPGHGGDGCAAGPGGLLALLGLAPALRRRRR